MFDDNCDSVISRQGARHGFSLSLSRAGRLESVGWWRQGRRTGTWWRSVQGGAWLVTNTNTNLAIFIYPDLVTALLGNINTEDSTAEEELSVCEVTSLSVEAGVLLPGLSKSGGNIPANQGGHQITSHPITSHHITSHNITSFRCMITKFPDK